MKKNKFKLLFVLPFFDNVGDYVRGTCLKNFAPEEWEFIYIKGSYPKIFNIYLLRYFYRILFYLYKIIYYSFNNYTVAYFLIPQNPILLFTLKYIFRIKLMIDISDAQHLNQFLGYKKTLSIIKNSNYVIYEAKESEDFWIKKHNIPGIVCEDTPQHECIYINYKNRTKKLIWVGSFHTSNYLLNFKEYFKIFSDKGYEIVILGGTKKLSNEFNKLNIIHSYTREYNLKKLIIELSSSKISFIPMENNDLFNFRGSLKAKVSMAYGCLVIASNNPAHRKLITNHNTGYLFEDLENFKNIIKKIENNNVSQKIALSGNQYVAKNYTMTNHANNLVNVAKKLIN